MMVNQFLQTIASNSNSNNGNDQNPAFMSLLEAYQREKTMNEMIFQSLLGSSLQQQSQQNSQQNQQRSNNGLNHGPNYAALLAAANAQNGLNQQQQLLQQALSGQPLMNSGLPGLLPSSSNSTTDNALMAFLQASNPNNGSNHTLSAPTSQDSNPSGDPINTINTPAPAPLVQDPKLVLSPKDSKIDLASALNGNFKTPSLLPNLKAPSSSFGGLNNPNNDVSTLDTAALLTLLTSGRAGGAAPATKMVEAPAPMAPIRTGMSSNAPANTADATLLAMIQQVQQQQQQPKVSLPSMLANNTIAPTSRTSSPELKPVNNSNLDAVRAVSSLLAPIAPMPGAHNNGNNTSSNTTANLAMAVEIASSKSMSQADASSKRKNGATPQASGSIPSFIEPQSNDVLFGKGRTKHQGNRHLQKLIENLMAVYEAATKQQKKELADMVVTKILNSGGRFLKLDEDSQRWDEVEREDAHKKVAHAFRNLRRRNK